MKYYLLTYNRYFADEHRVPALACMNEDEYNTWLDTQISFEPDDYQSQVEEFQRNKARATEIRETLRDQGVWGFGYQPMTPEQKSLMEEWKSVEPKSRYTPQRMSAITAFLGNSGDGFDDEFGIYKFAKELVDNKIVKVTQVSIDFFNTFYSNGLGSLSLTNIFDVQSIKERMEDFKDENDD